MDAHSKPDLIEVDGRQAYDKVRRAYTAEAFSEVELSYFAGYFEADGHCSFYTTSTGFLGNVSIEQKDRALLETFRQWFGGKMSLKAKQEIWTWQVYGHQAKALLQLIRPYIRTYRAEKVDRFVRFFSTMDGETRMTLIVEDRKATEGHRKRLSDLALEREMRQSNPTSENHGDQ